MLAAGPGEFKIRILMPASPQGIGLKSEQYGQRHFLKTCGVSRAARRCQVRACNLAFRRPIDGTRDGVGIAAGLDRRITDPAVQLLERQSDGRHTLKQGHAKLRIALEDDDRLHGLATAELAFPVLAADIDRFATRLREMEKEQFGEANLAMAM